MQCLSEATVQEFIACHDGAARFRRPILAIVGGTRLGKSMLAVDINALRAV